MNKQYDMRFCSIINDVCPEKTDGEVTYCNYYCQLYTVYHDYKHRSRQIKDGEDE